MHYRKVKISLRKGRVGVRAVADVVMSFVSRRHTGRLYYFDRMIQN
jgi:hypothetical protein